MTILNRFDTHSATFRIANEYLVFGFIILIINLSAFRTLGTSFSILCHNFTVFGSFLLVFEAFECNFFFEKALKCPILQKFEFIDH